MGLLDRLLDLVKKHESPGLTADSPGLEIVAEAFDPVVADSAVLAGSPAWVSTAPAVLRHHLLLPPERVAEAASILAQDGYDLREVSPSDDPVRVHAVRVQVLDALHCAQERSRMAGLAQRLGGDALGWDALQPEAPA
ncbi:ribonuclease E inhibitor RraB [Amycolatopsis sp. RTGN1]|uniref:ribonuclease E inhibitor RraB n=1 Tax=Amycolatopsis ponsaeliensis TaxID=2992142 RepID=UPI00254F61F1|nr:ribonuclease E inhibitor RraB [Amycolatopsis sp. RTGN1]